MYVTICHCFSYYYRAYLNIIPASEAETRTRREEMSLKEVVKLQVQVQRLSWREAAAREIRIDTGPRDTRRGRRQSFNSAGFLVGPNIINSLDRYQQSRDRS